MSDRTLSPEPLLLQLTAGQAEIFGTTLTLSTGRVLPVRFIGEQHVLEDLGRIPTIQDWLGKIQPESWMLGRGKALAG